MDDISRLPHKLDKREKVCSAIIETPKGHRNKFKYEHEEGMFALAHVLPEGFIFPFDFGFVPSTVAEDGDPLDMIVLMDEPAHVGCLVKVRIIGVIKLVQTENGKESANDRLIGVTVQSDEYKDVKSIEEVNRNFVQQITEFIGLYNKNSKKDDEVKGVEGPEKALELLEQAIANFEGKQK
jgi:inorganic pyrophosphatase